MQRAEADQADHHRTTDALAPAKACAFVSLAFVAAYGLANRLTSLRPDVGRGVFDWERAIPFVEWTIVPYGVLAILWVRLAPNLSGTWRLALHSWFAAIAGSVLTTYQHHVIDIPAGLAVATLSLAATARGRLAWLQRLQAARLPALARAVAGRG